MGIVNTLSLSNTLDKLNEAFFFGKVIAEEDKIAAAQWIAGRQGLAGAYYGMFAPTTKDMESPVFLFTGEKITSRVGRCHILGEEASRNLLLLNVQDKEVKNAWQAANSNMLRQLRDYEAHHTLQGMYCCGTCSTAYWRNITAGGLDRKEERLEAAMRMMKSLRKGQGQWRSVPLYHALLAIMEIDLKSAVEEMRYAASTLEKKLRNFKTKDKYQERRKKLAERVLAKC
jgi:hypothetical protein